VSEREKGKENKGAREKKGKKIREPEKGKS